MFEIFSWLKVCVSFLPRSPGVSFHKRTKLFLMLFFKLWNMADFLAENRKLLSSALTGPLLYLYFLYGSSSKFWTVKLRRKNLISDIHKKKWNIKVIYYTRASHTAVNDSPNFQNKSQYAQTALYPHAKSYSLYIHTPARLSS